MTSEIENGKAQLIMEVVDAMNDLTILARLEFAKNIVFGNGGNKGGYPQNPALILAHDVLSDVIDVLKKHPKAGGLRTPEP